MCAKQKKCRQMYVATERTHFRDIIFNSVLPTVSGLKEKIIHHVSCHCCRRVNGIRFDRFYSKHLLRLLLFNSRK